MQKGFQPIHPPEWLEEGEEGAWWTVGEWVDSIQQYQDGSCQGRTGWRRQPAIIQRNTHISIKDMTLQGKPDGRPGPDQSPRHAYRYTSPTPPSLCTYIPLAAAGTAAAAVAAACTAAPRLRPSPKIRVQLLSHCFPPSLRPTVASLGRLAPQSHSGWRTSAAWCLLVLERRGLDC
jgi:hypothetical protein